MEGRGGEGGGGREGVLGSESKASESTLPILISPRIIISYVRNAYQESELAPRLPLNISGRFHKQIIVFASDWERFLGCCAGKEPHDAAPCCQWTQMTVRLHGTEHTRLLCQTTRHRSYVEATALSM